MTALYVESSVVLTWLLEQPRSEEVLASINDADAVVTSALTFAETGRALVRAEETKRLRAAEAQKLRGLLQRARAGWITMVISEEVMSRTVRPFPIEPVRTLDAIHLATMLEFIKVFPDLEILSFDTRILDNATALGLGIALERPGGDFKPSVKRKVRRK